MNVTTRHAVVSWCPDLTDPQMTALPIAVLLVARTEQRCFATAVAFEVDTETDPLTAATLNDVTVVIRSHIDAIVRQGGSTNDVLDQLATSLRGSLHVASISEESEMQIADPMEFAPAAHRLLLQEVARVARALPRPRQDMTERAINLLPHVSEEVSGMQHWQIPQCKSPVMSSTL